MHSLPVPLVPDSAIASHHYEVQKLLGDIPLVSLCREEECARFKREMSTACLPPGFYRKHVDAGKRARSMQNKGVKEMPKRNFKRSFGK